VKRGDRQAREALVIMLLLTGIAYSMGALAARFCEAWGL